MSQRHQSHSHCLCPLPSTLGHSQEPSPSGVKEMSQSHRVDGSSPVWTSGSQSKLTDAWRASDKYRFLGFTPRKADSTWGSPE